MKLSRRIRRRLPRRINDLTRGPWHDWGHRLMALVGQDNCGNWSSPTPPTWWYRHTEPRPMWHTRYPTWPRRSYEIIKDYRTFRARTEWLNKDQLDDWKAIYVGEDDDLRLGHQYWGGDFYGLTRWEARILARYLRAWRRLDWWGLRSWLYSQGLHAAVHHKIPFRCHATPPRGSGGYQHWHCTEKRGHQGLHRFNAYVWGDIEGEPMPVTHMDQEASR